jgi:hypothetical protein
VLPHNLECVSIALFGADISRPIPDGLAHRALLVHPPVLLFAGSRWGRSDYARGSDGGHQREGARPVGTGTRERTHSWQILNDIVGE